MAHSQPSRELRGKLRPAAGDLSWGVPHLFAAPPIPRPAYDPYAPYAEAWREYDRLEKWAKGGSGLGWIHWSWGWITGMISLVDPHKHTKRVEQAIFLAACILALFAGLRSRYAASRLAHWPCPRCHAEWPGKKLNKEPRCAVCGLRLGQTWS